MLWHLGALANVKGCLPNKNYEVVQVLVGRPDERRPMAVPTDKYDYMAALLRRKRQWELSGVDSLVEGLDDPRWKGLPPPDPTSTFVDVGANLGVWTMNFAHRGHSVLAVEPMARNRAALQATLCLNPDLAPRVKVVAAALGSPEEMSGDTACALRAQRLINEGDGMLDCGVGVSCNATRLNPPKQMLRRRQGKTGGSMKLSEWLALPCEDVPMLTLARVLVDGLAHGARVGVMKIDAEEHECAVLSGADFSRPRWRPSLLASEWNQPFVEQCFRAAGARWGYSHVNSSFTNAPKRNDRNEIMIDTRTAR